MSMDTTPTLGEMMPSY